MKRYRVIFEESAQENVRESYDWGCLAWGKREARQWARELRDAVVKQLARIIHEASRLEQGLGIWVVG